MRSSFAFFCLIVLAAPVVATAEEKEAKKKPPLTVTIEKSDPRRTEHTTIIFEESKAQLVLNSNFMQDPALGDGTVLLGHFEAPLNERLKTEAAELGTAALRAEKQEAPGTRPLLDQLGEPYASPHRTRILLNGRELAPNSIHRRAILALFADSAEVAEWKAVEGLEVTTKGPKILARPLGASKETAAEIPTTACETRPKQRLCRTSQGWAYLQRRDG